jgi:hypothetical protein
VRGSNRAGETAETLILVGLILDIIGEVILLFVGLFLLIVPVFGAIFLGFALVGFVWIALVWMFSYGRVREGDYEGARTPTLVFAILSFITFALIPAILFLIAYIKLGDAIDQSVSMAPAWGTQPLAPTPGLVAAATKYCSHCGRANSPTNTFCQGCGAPLG